MNIVIINKSDTTGGAAVVSMRLLNALREAGHDARMLVAERKSDSPYVEKIASGFRLKSAFIADRIPMAYHNGMSRSTLFKIDGAIWGIDITSNPLVKSADAIFINWINQGVLSLEDIYDLSKLGKKIIWTMHDMWNFTGICHHAGDCNRYIYPLQCGLCPLLRERFWNKNPSFFDLSYQTFFRKLCLYKLVDITFVAVSSWLEQCARQSTLLKNQKIKMIPNAFPLPDIKDIHRTESAGRIRLIFAAARVDDDIKDFPTLKEALRFISEHHPEIAEKMEITIIGGIKNRSLLKKFPISMQYRGIVNDQKEMQRAYQSSDIVISSSEFETLPGTLIEGQAYGAIPVAFDRGGQRDIITPGETGCLAQWDSTPEKRAESLANAIIEAVSMLGTPDLHLRLYRNVADRFSPHAVAYKYLDLII